MWLEYLLAISHKHRNYCSFFIPFTFCGQDTQPRNAISLLLSSTFWLFCVRKLLWGCSRACLEHVIAVQAESVLGLVVPLNLGGGAWNFSSEHKLNLVLRLILGKPGVGYKKIALIIQISSISNFTAVLYVFKNISINHN